MMWIELGWEGGWYGWDEGYGFGGTCGLGRDGGWGTNICDKYFEMGKGGVFRFFLWKYRKMLSVEACEFLEK